jgi:hypothetical protein
MPLTDRLGHMVMTGPAWLGACMAALMLLIAACCASRLVLWRLRGRDIEFDADAVHVPMGVAMAGMLEPRLSPVPDMVWLAVFAAAAAWFFWQAIRSRSRARRVRRRCAHPAPHAVECAAMVYMLLPVGRAAHGLAPAMSGMSGGSTTVAGNPALALVLALFMLGYTMWTTDQLAALSRAGAEGSLRAARALGSVDGRAASGPTLAPRLAACYKIAMSIGMGYMLVTML